MSKRLITENWYKFLKEHESPFTRDQEQEMYSADDTIPADTARALQEIARLNAEIAILQKELADWEEQIGHDVHSVSQMKEDKDG